MKRNVIKLISLFFAFTLALSMPTESAYAAAASERELTIVEHCENYKRRKVVVHTPYEEEQEEEIKESEEQIRLEALAIAAFSAKRLAIEAAQAQYIQDIQAINARFIAAADARFLAEARANFLRAQEAERRRAEELDRRLSASATHPESLTSFVFSSRILGSSSSSSSSASAAAWAGTPPSGALPVLSSIVGIPAALGAGTPGEMKEARQADMKECEDVAYNSVALPYLTMLLTSASHLARARLTQEQVIETIAGILTQESLSHLSLRLDGETKELIRKKMIELTSH